MQVLVTGGGGFLGYHICHQLRQKGFSVTSLSRNYYPKLNEIGVKQIKADLSVYNDMANLFKDHQFETIIHTASKAGIWGAWSEYYQLNVQGTQYLIELAKKNNVKYFIYTSTPSVVFGQHAIKNGDESLLYPTDYLTFYAKSKSIAENIVLTNDAKNFKTAAIRPHLIWGPGDPHLLPRLVQKAKAGKLFRIGAGLNLVDVTYVENAALSHVLMLEQMIKKPQMIQGAYFIGDEKPVELWKFIDQLLVRSGVGIVRRDIPLKLAIVMGYFFEFIYNLFALNGEPPMTRFVALQLGLDHYFSHEKAKRDFNYKAKYSLEESFTRTFI